MSTLALFFKILALFCAFSILLGFVKPTLVIWWARTQNRIHVLKLYGSLATVSFLVWIILRYLSH